MLFHEEFARTALEKSGASDGLIQLHSELWELLDPPVSSEYPVLLGQYRSLLNTLRTWDELPASNRATEINEIELRLAPILREKGQRTTPISTEHLKSHWVWSALDSAFPYPHTAISGLTGFMLLLKQDDELSLSKRIASTIRGRDKSRRLTQAEKRSGFLPPKLGDLLEHQIPLGARPSEQFRLLADAWDQLIEAKPHFDRLLRKLAPHFAERAEHPAPSEQTVLRLGQSGQEAAAPEDENSEEILSWYGDLLEPERPSDDLSWEYHQQAIWSRNNLLLEGHATALTTSQATFLTQRITQRVSEAFREEGSRPATEDFIRLLVLITGRTLPLATALLASVFNDRPNPNGRLDLKREGLILPAKMPDSAFRPDPEDSGIFKDTTDEFHLPLPPPLIQLIRQWKDSTRPRSLAEAEKAASTNFDWEGNITRGRIRQWLGTRLMTLTRDPAIVRWITGDTHGQSQGYLHYAHIPISALINSYKRAVWPLFGLPPGTTPRGSGAVGSRALPNREYVSGHVQALNRRFTDSRFSRHDPHSVAERHNSLVHYVTSQLAMLTGHRICRRLLSLRRDDLCLSTDGKQWCGFGLFSDKRINAAFFLRPVPLGAHLAEQIGLYYRHLDKLSNALPTLGCEASLPERISVALNGSGPIFFLLDAGKGGMLKPNELKFERWHRAFKSSFPGLPSNFGRHYLANESRGISDAAVGGGELACLILGHLDTIGQPYGKDSPTTITEFAELGGTLIDHAYANQGWKRQGGLVSAPRKDRFRPVDVPGGNLQLRDWESVQHQFDKQIDAQRSRIERERQARLDERRDEAYAQFLEALQEIKPELADQLLNTEELAPKPDEPITLEPSELKQALASPPALQGQSIAEERAATWARLQVARELLEAAKERGVYDGRLPSRVYSFDPGEKTPLLPGSCQAYSAILALREWFADRILPTNPQDDAVARYGALAAACILFGGVYDEVILRSLLARFRDFQRCPAYPDAILIELDVAHPVTWVLFGLPAMLAVKLAQAQLPVEVPETDELSVAIFDQMPEDCRPSSRPDALSFLLQAAARTATIELSGLARHSISSNPSIGSWSIPLTRQIALLCNRRDTLTPEESSQATEALPQAPSVIDKDWYFFLTSEANKCKSSSADDSKSTPKRKKAQRRREKAQKRRSQAARDIETEMQTRSLHEIESALGIWLVKMLKEPRTGGEDPLAGSTAHTYLTSVGSRLLALIGARPIATIEPDEWQDIYGAVVEGNTGDLLNRKLDQIHRFHRVLQDKFNAPPLTSACLPAKADPEPHVRNSIALPIEIDSALTLLKNELETASLYSETRSLRQSLVAFILMASTGCRIGEVAKFEFRDLRIRTGISYLRVRPNSLGDTKTPSAARIVEFSLSDSEYELVRDYLVAEWKRLGPTGSRSHRAIFTNLAPEWRGTPLGAETLRFFIRAALRQFSPVNLVAHDLRHTHGTRVQCELALNQATDPSSTKPTIGLSRPEPDALQLPRHAALRAMRMGHSRSSTTEHHYGGLPWLHLVRYGLQQSRYLSPTSLSMLLAVEAASARRYFGRHGEQISAWVLDRLGSRIDLQTPDRNAHLSAPSGMLLQPTKAVPPAIEYLCDAHAHDAEDAYAAFGISDRQYASLRKMVDNIYQDTRFALLPSCLPRSNAQSRTDKPPKWNSASRALRTLAEDLYNQAAPIHAIADSYREQMTPNQAQSKVTLPTEAAARLNELLAAKAPEVVVDLKEYGTKTDIKVKAGQRSVTRNLAWVLLSINAVRSI